MRFLSPRAHLSTYFGQKFVNPYNNLLGGFYRLNWFACAEAIAVHVKDFGIVRCPHFEKKKRGHRNKELTTVEFELGTTGSEITDLPTKPRGSWRVQLIEKAICLWFLCPMMDLGKRRCLQVPTCRTAPCSFFAATKWRQGSSTVTEWQA